ncbi:MAG: hypothetical protein H7267_08700 [Sandarakinorhabdus sp.]|nr:hypothetical protein [Sandarakinorhabdus sp.]
MTTIGIFGTGGLAREAGDIVAALGWTPLYIARDVDEQQTWIGSDFVVLESEIERYRNLGFVIGIGEPKVRQRLARHFTGAVHFTNLIHPDTSFGKGARDAVDARSGVIICPGVRLTNAIAVGDFAIINPNVTVGHDTIVQEFVTICPGANISGNVCIETRAWIGAGAVINQGSAARKLTIGADAVIGSGAVVVRDCDAGGTYAGVPARKLR